MAEFEDKLSAILGDPEAMGQIVSIAKALTAEAGAGPEDTQEPSPTVTIPTGGEAQAEAAPGQLDWGAIMGLLGGLTGGGGNAAPNPLGALADLDPRLIQTALRLFAEYSATDDRKIALLSALKPFLKEARYAKVDKAIQIAKLSRVIRVAFQLFKKEGGEGDV